MALQENFLFLCFAIILAVAGASPNGFVVETMFKQLLTTGRISDNIIEDANLDVPELVRKYRYPLEVHTVTTEDGYILTMHRIPHGRDNHNVPGKRPVVFLMHGLLSSSADFILLGPGSSLAYILAEEGFDVWLGNARGNYYSRKHVRLNPDSWFSTAFWQFSWDEIGNIDLPTMIDYVLNATGRQRLHYIGHSQGTTTFFVLGSLRPQYNDKIISMHALAPGAYMEHSPNLLLRFISQFANNLEYALSLIGVGEFFPNNNVMTWAAYILAEEGFDVWLGNARGNYYSRKHVRLNPDSWFSTAFWQFSWDEIGNIDLPTMIDYVLNATGRQRLHYIGHSQGTTTFFVLGSLRPQYNDKIISMHALAPGAYMEHSPNLLLRFISQFANNLEYALSLIGVGEFFPNNNVMTWAGQALCMDEVVFQPLCTNIVFLLGGWNENQHNATMIPVKLGHAPAGAAARQFVHYAQSIASKQFRRYDHGSILANRRAYGSWSPPSYDLSKITTPVFLHYSDTDPMSHVRDVDRLFRELGRPIGKFRVPEATFSHFDFIWAIKGRELLYDRVINLMWAMDSNSRNSTGSM